MIDYQNKDGTSGAICHEKFKTDSFRDELLKTIALTGASVITEYILKASLKKIVDGRKSGVSGIQGETAF